MELLDIHWQDSLIRKVVELPDPVDGKHGLLLEIKAPVDWQNKDYQILTIRFHDISGYAIHEGACWAAPRILEAKEMTATEDGGTRTIRIVTTAGYRTIQCTSLSLENGEAVD